MQKKKVVKKVRLPLHILPTKYKVKLYPDLEARAFSGEVTIYLDVTKPTKTITLHAKELEITDSFIVVGKQKLFSTKVTINDKEETAALTFERVLSGSVELTLSFKGLLNKHMRGFYESTYTLNGKEELIATTQFEATDARRCIPCFDEPNFKAVFEVEVIVPDDKDVISNTLPVAVREHHAGMKVVSFAPTPRMSTYLLAFIVGNFEYLEAKTKRGVRVRVYTVPGKKIQGRFALETAVKCIDFYETYFGITYPINTLDMIALPDFEASAMENWGAVTYREASLLIDEKNSAVSNKQLVAIVVAHELAHQWFGNLVTMDWWNDLWLNEGFASYMEYVAVDHLFPEWNIWNRFVVSDHGGALDLDQLEHTHKIDVPVHHPDEIQEIFDHISYLKGSVVIRQLAGFIGERQFRNGLRHYLKKHSYKNTKTSDLWDAFSEASGLDVRAFMKNWIGEPGYPLVIAKEAGTSLTLEQKRFMLKSKQTTNTIWQIPVSVKTDRSSTQVLFKAKKMKIDIGEHAYFKLNTGEIGFYRTLYSTQALFQLSNVLREGRMPIADRLGILRDVFAFVRAGIMPAVEALKFAELFKNETEYVVWAEIIGGVKSILKVLEGDDRKRGKLYLRDVLEDAVTRVGFSKQSVEEYEQTLLRALILREAGIAGDTRVVSWALKRFKDKKTYPIEPDLRTAIYTIVSSRGGIPVVRELLAMYEHEENAQEKVRILAALGATGESSQRKKLLDYCFSSRVKLQDRFYLFGALAANHDSRAFTFSYLMKHWKKVGELESTRRMMHRFVEAFDGFSTKAELVQFKAFFRSHPVPQAARAILQTGEQIEINIKVRQKNTKQLSVWLKRKFPTFR